MKDRADTFGPLFSDSASLTSSKARGDAAAEMAIHMNALEKMVKDTSDAKPYIGGLTEPTALDISMHGIATMAGPIGTTKAIPKPPFTKNHDANHPNIGKYLQRMQSKTDEWRKSNPPKSNIPEKEVAAFLLKHSPSALPSVKAGADPAGLDKLVGKSVGLYQTDAAQVSLYLLFSYEMTDYCRRASYLKLELSSISMSKRLLLKCQARMES